MHSSLSDFTINIKSRFSAQILSLPSFPTFKIHPKAKRSSKISSIARSNLATSRQTFGSPLKIYSYQTRPNLLISHPKTSKLTKNPPATFLQKKRFSYKKPLNPLEMKGIKIKPQRKNKLPQITFKAEIKPVIEDKSNDSASSYGSSELENEVQNNLQQRPSILMLKFNSPFVRKQSSKKSTVGSLVSEYSLRNFQNSLKHQPTIEEILDELNSTPNVEVYNDLKLKLMGEDPILGGINGELVKWRVVETIGIGGFGQVLKTLNVSTGNFFVVKRLFYNPQSIPQVVYIESLKKEIEILKPLTHPNIVKYLGSETLSGSHYLYLEYLAGGSISKLLYKMGPLPEAAVKQYTSQLIKGLKYLHDNGIIHRDIKSENILLDTEGKIKLTDFGCSRKYNEELTETGMISSMKGSLMWMAPEVMKQSGYGRKADIWSLGCVVIEMLTAKPPWAEAENQINLMMKVAIFNEIPLIPEGISPECKDFLLSCLRKDPKNRPTAAELLSHNFIL